MEEFMRKCSSKVLPTLVIGDGDLVTLSSALVDGGHVQDTVSIDVERDFDLRDTSWSWWDSSQLEFSQQIVVLGHRTLSLVNLDEYTGLVVTVGCECLLLLGGDGDVTLDECCHHTAGGLDTERQRGNVKKEQVLDLF